LTGKSPDYGIRFGYVRNCDLTNVGARDVRVDVRAICGHRIFVKVVSPNNMVSDSKQSEIESARTRK
jgi:hypothetical protein